MLRWRVAAADAVDTATGSLLRLAGGEACVEHAARNGRGQDGGAATAGEADRHGAYLLFV